MRLDPNIIKQQINNLLLQFPEMEEDETLRADMIEGGTDLHDFLRMIERQRQQATHMAGAIASNIAELGLRQERFERREQAIRTLMFKIMQYAHQRNAELPEATISIRAGTQKVIITDEALITPDYIRIVQSPDKTKIKEALTSGQDVSGAELSNAEPTLSIKTK